jgi:hypothetical protein
MLRDLNAGRKVRVPSGGSSYKPPVHKPSGYHPGGQQPRTKPARSGGGRRGRVLLGLLVAAALVFAVIRFWPFGGDSTQGAVFAPKIAANQPIGSCLKEKKGWEKDKNDVEIVDCAEKHWGEVIAYLKITASPAKYPGYNQTDALASFQCGEAFVQQGIPADKYTTSYAVADQAGWNKDGYENYTTCVAHDRDDKGFKGRIGHPESPKVPKPVSMNLTSVNLKYNAPVGLCLQAKPTDQNSKAMVVRCELPHWGELLGYPDLVWFRTQYPGSDAVKAASDVECVRLFNHRKPGAKGFTKWFVYPGKEWWDEEETSSKYSYCVLTRADAKPFKGKP